MKKNLIALVIFGILSILILGSFSIIRTPNGISILSKDDFLFENEIVDVSEWDIIRCSQNPFIRDPIINGKLDDDFNRMESNLTAVQIAIDLGFTINEARDLIKQGVISFDKQDDDSKDVNQDEMQESETEIIDKPIEKQKETKIVKVPTKAKGTHKSTLQSKLQSVATSQMRIRVESEARNKLTGYWIGPLMNSNIITLYHFTDTQVGTLTEAISRTPYATIKAKSEVLHIQQLFLSYRKDGRTIVNKKHEFCTGIGSSRSRLQHWKDNTMFKYDASSILYKTYWNNVLETNDFDTFKWIINNGDGEQQHIITRLSQTEYEMLKRVNVAPNYHALLEVIKDERAIVRLYAARMFSFVNDPRKVEVFITSLNDRNVEIRRIAAKTLGELRDKRALNSLASSLIKDVDSNVRVIAAEAIGVFNSGESAGYLFLALYDQDANVRSMARKALEGIQGELIIPVNDLINGLKSSEYFIRSISEKALNRMPVNKKVSALLRAIHHDDTRISLYAINALSEVKDERIIEPLLSIIFNGNYETKRPAEKVLLSYNNPRTLELLIAEPKQNETDRLITISLVKELTNDNPGKDWKAWQRWWEGRNK